jgi:hypothetical protein
MVSGFLFTNHTAVIVEVVAHLVPKVRRHKRVNGERDSLGQKPRLKQDFLGSRGIGTTAMFGHLVSLWGDIDRMFSSVYPG